MKRNTVKNKILKTINSRPDHEWSAAEVAEAAKQKPANAGYHLRTLLKEGRILKSGPGRFTAVSAVLCDAALSDTVEATTKTRPAAKPALPTQPVVTFPTDEVTARLWSEVLKVEIDADTVRTLSGLQRVSQVIEEAVTAAR